MVTLFLLSVGVVSLLLALVGAVYYFLYMRDHPYTWYYNRAIDAYQQKQYARAIDQLEQALARNKEATEVHYNLALCYQQLENLEAAKESYRQVIHLNPADGDAQFNLGILLLEEGDLPTALTCLLGAQSTMPDDRDTAESIARIYESQKERDKAIEAYQQVVLLDNQNVSAYLHLGKLLDQTGQYDEAVSAYQQVLESDPNSLDANYELSITLAKKGDWQGTIDFSTKAIDIDPSYAKAHNQLGLAYYCNEQPESSIEHYQNAIRIDPNYANAFNNLAYAFEKCRQYNEAIDMFELYLAKNTDEEEAREVREHISMLEAKIVELEGGPVDESPEPPASPASQPETPEPAQSVEPAGNA